MRVEIRGLEEANSALRSDLVGEHLIEGNPVFAVDPLAEDTPVEVGDAAYLDDWAG